MRYCDHTESVIRWSSEEVIIPYRSPIDGKRHRYFPDFWLRILGADGQIKETLIEIKKIHPGGEKKQYRRQNTY